MMGVFVQVNTESRKSKGCPTGYVIQENGCWDWIGCKDRGGYSGIRFGPNRNRSAHVHMYEKMVGPIPGGMQLDHLCRNRVCVNPAHLEPVTPRDNVLRSTAQSAVNATKTHCVNGHPFSGDNLSTREAGRRRCITCQRQAERKYNENRPPRRHSPMVDRLLAAAGIERKKDA